MSNGTNLAALVSEIYCGNRLAAQVGRGQESSKRGQAASRRALNNFLLARHSASFQTLTSSAAYVPPVSLPFPAHPRPSP